MIKKIHLFLFIICLFIASFIVINSKYDKFYRVSGINNENRLLLENYLSEDEQNYLIENRIPISQFLKYIKCDNFILQNYEYYNLLYDTNRYSNMNRLVNTGNSLKDKLESLKIQNINRLRSNIIDNDLEQGFIKFDTFDINNITIYSYIRPLYGSSKYVTAANKYIDILKDRGMTDESIQRFMMNACLNYNQKSLKRLMKQDDKSIALIDDPSNLTCTLNKNTYIATYEPKDLVLLQDLPRVKFELYARKDVSKQLKKMYKKMGDYKDECLVKSAYLSYSELKENKMNPGFNEYQLGNTIEFTSSVTGYNLFEQSGLYKWLLQHSYEYGFIKRYKNDSHAFRYVGIENAKKIHDSNIQLEELIQ